MHESKGNLASEHKGDHYSKAEAVQRLAVGESTSFQKG